MNRVTVTVKLYSGIMREVKAASKRWGVSIDDTINDMLRQHLSKDARNEEAMRIIRDAAALIEKDKPQPHVGTIAGPAPTRHRPGEVKP